MKVLLNDKVSVSIDISDIRLIDEDVFKYYEIRSILMTTQAQIAMYTSKMLRHDDSQDRYEICLLIDSGNYPYLLCTFPETDETYIYECVFDETDPVI